jgi:hypothetical protein
MKGKTMKARTTSHRTSKTQAANSEPQSNPAVSVLPPRCQHRSPAGRQCTSAVASPDATLCSYHSSTQTSDSTDFSLQLVHGCGNLQEAQQISHSLVALYKLVAQGRISPRRAAVLAYVASLMLRTLKAIDYDHDRFGDRPITQPGEAEGDRSSETAEEEETEASSEADSDAEVAAASSEPPLAANVGPGATPLPDSADDFVDAVLEASKK